MQSIIEKRISINPMLKIFSSSKLDIHFISAPAPAPKLYTFYHLNNSPKAFRNFSRHASIAGTMKGCAAILLVPNS